MFRQNPIGLRLYFIHNLLQIGRADAKRATIMNESRIKILKEEDINKALFKLGIPMVVSLLVAALYNVIDTYFVSELGKEAVAAVSVAFPIQLIFLGIGLAFGADAGSSVYLGFLCSMMESVPVAEPEAFEIPLLLCHPEKDRWTPERISCLFFDRIRSAKERCTLKNAGHFPIEQPGIAQLEESVVSFIKKYY